MSCVRTAGTERILLEPGIPLFDAKNSNRPKLNRRLGFRGGAGAEFAFYSSTPASASALLRVRRRTTGGGFRTRHVEISIMATEMATASPPSLLLTSGASGRISALFSLRAMRSLMMLINAFFLLLLLPFRGRKPLSSSEKLSEDENKQRGPVVRVPATIVHWKSSSNSNSSPPPLDHDVAARRALAKLRVRQDDDQNSVRQFSIFATTRGETLFTQTWTPVSVNIRGVVILMHGLNEHSGRYSGFAKQLNANGFKVYGMDWIGAAIILKAMLDPKVEACIDGVVLTSPAVGVQPSHPIFVILAPVIAFLMPRYQLSAANKTGIAVSRDPAALAAKYSDPLVYTGAIRVRTGYEILRITSYLQQNLSKMKVPFLVLHGTADTVTDPGATQKLYDEASSTDKTITLYDGLLHDLLFEPEREAILKQIIDWLNHRT